MELLPEFGMSQTAIAMDFPATDTSLSCSPPTMPPWLRKRLSQTNSTPLSTVEQIDSKLRGADLRRQKFYDNLMKKARPKLKDPSQSSSHEEDRGQRLQAKLQAAEEKRMSILDTSRMRLAKVDELRQTAKTEMEIRCRKERSELGTKVEMRAREAEANRLRILGAYRLRMASVNERTSQLLMQRVERDRKYKERVHDAMYHKRTAAHKKRLGLLEAEKRRAHTWALKVKEAANSLTWQQEAKRSEMGKKLENRLKRARRKRTEYLLHKGRSYNSGDSNGNTLQSEADNLSKKLARHWTKFKVLQKTTAHLAKAYNELNINERTVKSMPFDQFALLIQSTTSLRKLTLLLDRLERRYQLSQEYGSTPNSSTRDDINHLLKRVATPKPKLSPRKAYSKIEEKKTTTVTQRSEKAHVHFSRYHSKIVLCAYMVMGHPDIVISKTWECEKALVKSAGIFVYEFELLIKILLNGPMVVPSEKSEPATLTRRTFRLQLAAFDAAWLSFLNSFVVWKAMDATSLEKDLISAACRLEHSMMQTCKFTSEGISSQLSYAMSTVQKQVSEDQELLREKVLHLGGVAGIERLQKALSETRTKFFNARKPISLITSVSAFISSSIPASPSSRMDKENNSAAAAPEQTSTARSLFKDETNTEEVKYTTSGSHVFQYPGKSLDMQNVMIINECVHGEHVICSFPGEYENFMKGWKETMENAYWDVIIESVKQDKPNYTIVLKLMTEVRDEIYVMASHSWKQQAFEDFDQENIIQVLNSGSLDFNYLSVIESAMTTLQKLCAPAYKEEMKQKHQEVLKELAQTHLPSDSPDNSQAIALIKGLRYVLQEIQKLKQEISKARIQMIEPILKGPEALNYLGQSFTNLYGDPSNAVSALPLTAGWLSLVRREKDVEWFEHKKSLLGLPRRYENTSSSLPSATLRTGGRLLVKMSSNPPDTTNNETTVGSYVECRGEEIDLLVRLGLMNMVTNIAGLTEEQLPETMNLNLTRLRGVQSRIQKIIVIATSYKRLCSCLDSHGDAGVQDIVNTICAAVEEEDNKLEDENLQSMKEIMASMLSKSLQAENDVFSRVSSAVHLATKGALLGGTGKPGKGLAEMALQKAGASLLVDEVVEAAMTLGTMAKVSVSIHSPWYANLIKD